jgi:hypothetical protein
MKRTIPTKARIILIGFLLVSVIAPSFGQYSSYSFKKVFSAQHSNFSINAAQEVEEDGTEKSIESNHLLYFTHKLQPLEAETLSIFFNQQVDSFFFVQLFSNISSQAP